LPEQSSLPVLTPEYKPPSTLQFIFGIVRVFVQAMIGAYGLTVLLHLVLRGMTGDEITMVAFQTTFAHLSWIPTLVLLPMCLVLRWWRPALLVTPAVFAFVFNYGGQFVPNTVPIGNESAQFTVLTYNLLGNDRGYDESLAIIRDADADIVALQELTEDGAALIEMTFVDDYPHRALHPRVGTTGQGVLSRFPLRDDEYWQNTHLPVTLGNQRLQFEFNGEWITFYNVHPTHPGMTGSFFNPTIRDQEIDDILERVDQETDMVLVVGDFNMPDLTDSYGQITEQLTDAYRVAGHGLGWTFPAYRPGREFSPTLREWVVVPPLLRLDYVFYSVGMRAIEADVLAESGGSDHLPVRVKLSLE